MDITPRFQFITLIKTAIEGASTVADKKSAIQALLLTSSTLAHSIARSDQELDVGSLEQATIQMLATLENYYEINLS